MATGAKTNYGGGAIFVNIETQIFMSIYQSLNEKNMVILVAMHKLCHSGPYLMFH